MFGFILGLAIGSLTATILIYALVVGKDGY